MRPSEVRKRVLHDHDTLRAMLETLEGLALEVASRGSGPQVGPLRLEGETLLETLLTHMGWEDRYLLDLIRMLRKDMDEEEQTLLDERILRDDVVAIDATDG